MAKNLPKAKRVDSIAIQGGITNNDVVDAALGDGKKTLYGYSFCKIFKLFMEIKIGSKAH